MRTRFCFKFAQTAGSEVWKMAANLSKVAGMGSCINGHVMQNDSAMPEELPGQEKVAILDAGAQYGKVI